MKTTSMLRDTTPTPDSIKDEINYFLDIHTEYFLNLAYRWKDEKKYEDIKDYQKVIVPKLPLGWTLIKMTTKPFGFQFKIASLPLNMYVVIIGLRNYGWKRIQ